jgi:hypothetical protein
VGKGKGRPVTCHEGTEGSIGIGDSFLTSALDGG